MSAKLSAQQLELDSLAGRRTQIEEEIKSRQARTAEARRKLDEIRHALPPETALLGWIDLDPGGPPEQDRSPYHWACVLRRDADPAWIRTRGMGPDGTWTKVDEQNSK